MGVGQRYTPNEICNGDEYSSNGLNVKTTSESHDKDGGQEVDG